MATYNGAQFIEKQLKSILKQLDVADELIVVDDCSTDHTREIIASFNDERIRLISSSVNAGHVRTFEKAISLATNDLIFLSDQDDIWEDGRTEIFKQEFINNPDLMLVTSSFSCIDERDNPVVCNLRKVFSEDSKRYHKNIASIFKGTVGYYGCAMAFRRELLPVILPIPHYVEAHDLWIGMAGNMLKSNQHLQDITLKHRIHSKNTSNLNRRFSRKMYSRYLLAKQYIELQKRVSQ